MFSWITSLFRPTESAKVHDIEAAYEPEIVITKKATAPISVGGRTFKFVFGIFTLGRVFSGRPTLWWTDLKSFFTASKLTVSVSAPRTVGTHGGAPSPLRPTSDQPEMVELSLTSSSRPTNLPSQTIFAKHKPTALPPAKIRTSPTPTPTSKASDRTISSPLPTPPVTPCPDAPSYYIPDFIAHIPYPIRVNAHYQPVGTVSEEWLNSYDVHPSARKRAAFEACNMGLLTAMSNPLSDNEHFRVQCDFINALFAWDDLTDEGGLRVDGQGTCRAANIIMNALHHPFSHETEFRCGRIFSCFWGRAIKLGCSEVIQRRFLEYMDLYMQAVHEQVLNREKDYLPSIEQWLSLRRDTGGLKICFMIGAFGLQSKLPDEIFDHPLVRVMEDCANDVVVLSNDIYSYNIEQAQGDTCNIISVAMKQSSIDVQAAMDYAGQIVKGRIDKYVETKAKLPSWGPEVDAELHRYLSVLEDWMTGNFYWSLESQRYFGSKVRVVKRTMRVELLPREAPRGQMEIPGLESS